MFLLCSLMRMPCHVAQAKLRRRLTVKPGCKSRFRIKANAYSGYENSTVPSRLLIVNLLTMYSQALVAKPCSLAEA